MESPECRGSQHGSEHGFQGGKTVIKDAVRAWKQSHQEVFLPLSHPPGEAQVDFGEATVKLNAVERKVALFVMTLPYSSYLAMTVTFFIIAMSLAIRGNWALFGRFNSRPFQSNCHPRRRQGK